jgi:ABC-type phosphate transport system substrate-binding protein
MQPKRIAAAIAATTLLQGGAALAHDPGVTPDIEIFMSGATAQDGNLGQLFTELCVSGTLDEYRDNASASSPGSAHRAYFCTLDSSKVTGLTQNNPRVLLHKRAAGGSAQGVNPVVDEQAIDAMSIKNGNCTAPVAPDTFYRCRISQAGDLEKQVSDAGVSDVNPEMFAGPNTPAGSSPANALKIGERMEVRSGGALVFNAPVTLSLRNALQEAQLATGALPADCAVGNETELCMPSLSRYLIASLFTGNIGKWSEIKVVMSDGSSQPLTSYAKAGDISDDKVRLCRRVNGSGTQAQFNAKFLNTPCSSGALAPIATSNPLAGPVVVLNSGAGDVDNCLDDFNAGANNSAQNANGDKAWAIGVQSTERNVSLSKQYRFVKIDGAAPTLENAASGHYFDFAEVTYQYRKPAFNGPTGDKLTIIQKIASDAGKPSIIAKNNQAYVHPFGRAGYLAVSRSGFAVPSNAVFDPNTPVTPYTHAPGGLSLDNCRAPVIDDNKANRL